MISLPSSLLLAVLSGTSWSHGNFTSFNWMQPEIVASHGNFTSFNWMQPEIVATNQN